MRKRKPVAVGEILSEILRNMGVEKKVKEEMAINYWADVVGPHIERVSKVEKVENGVLYVKVINPAWKHHLFMLKQEIISKLNGKLKSKAIHDIIFIDSGYDFKNKE